MLYKLFFIGVIIFCSAGIGNAMIGEKKERIEALKKLAEGCRVLSETMELQTVAMPQALQAAQAASCADCFTALSSLLQQHPNGEIKALAKQSIGQTEKMRVLRPAEQEIFADFIWRLASALTASQIQDARNMFARQMDALLEQLQQEQQAKAKVIRAMSISIGLMIAVILI